MLSVVSTKNIENYKSDFIGGFNLKEFAAIFVGAVLGIGIILVCAFVLNVPIMFCPYLAAPFVGTPIIFKFYKKNGMSYTEAKKREKIHKSAKMNTYYSTENASVYMNYYNNSPLSTGITAEDEFEQTLKKLKKVALISVIVIILSIVAIVVFTQL